MEPIEIMAFVAIAGFLVGTVHGCFVTTLIWRKMFKETLKQLHKFYQNEAFSNR